MSDGTIHTRKTHGTQDDDTQHTLRIQYAHTELGAVCQPDENNHSPEQYAAHITAADKNTNTRRTLTAACNSPQYTQRRGDPPRTRIIHHVHEL